MSIIWRKVWRDLWHNKLRTCLAILSIGIGVFALGFVQGTSGVLATQLTESHWASVPPHLSFHGMGRFDQDVVDAILRESEVASAEGDISVPFRWKLAGEEDWREGTIMARVDYEAQQMNRFELVAGDWPGQAGRALAVERMTSSHFDVPLGSTVIVKRGPYERQLPVTGVLRHPQAVTPVLLGPIFFGTLDTVAWVTGTPRAFDRLYVRLHSFDTEQADQVGQRVQRRLERMDIRVGYYLVIDPDIHLMQEVIDALGLILKILAGLSLALSGFLIANVMNALIAQQVWQVGVMKVIGATFGRVMRIYLATALVYGLLSLFLAVPLGAAMAYVLAAWMLRLLNVQLGAFHVLPEAIAIQVGVGILVPALAGLVPVAKGALISPHQAIGYYGLDTHFGRSRLDRLVVAVRHLSPPTILSLRNVFRRKVRVTLALVTLVLCGIVFIMVASASTSMNNTIEVLLDDFGFDALVAFEQPKRVSQLLEVTQRLPGVARAEVWERREGYVTLPDDESLDVSLWGVPLPSEMFDPRIVSGRPLQPGDGRAILLNSKIAADEGIDVGNEIQITIGGRASNWTVVGLVLNINNLQRDNFVPFGALARASSSFDRGSIVMVKSEQHDPSMQRELVRRLREAYTANYIEPADLQSAREVQETNQALFDTITYLMLTMVILMAVVGSVGLMGTMAINVVERQQEIGVMRAVGATSLVVVRIFVVEGVLVGVLSWLLAVPISYPGSQVFSRLVSDQLFGVPLDFDYSIAGAIGWLLIVVTLSALASLWPALSATQISVREALVYE
ncbi:MAG TPA: FtsX-like permease family protein [Chloroflexi bacterium]|nr:FtsX-like permease family protein [Chloroflexota bacterium]